MNNKNAEEQLGKFKSIIESIKTGILITQSDDEKLCGRPMSTIEVDDEGKLWFFTSEYSGKVKQISHNDNVFISYASPAENRYMVVSGTAFIVDDKAKMEELWNPILKVWFPDGLETPNIALLKIEPNEVEYWDGSSSKIVVLFKMLSSIITGKAFKDGEHNKLDVSDL